MKGAVNNKIAAEARARIHWGHSPDRVLFWLQCQGVSHQAAEDILEPAIAGRSAEIRKRGLLGGLIGLAAMALTLTMAGTLNPESPGDAKSFGLCAVIACFGMYKMVQGAIYLVRGKMQGSLTE